MRPSPLVFNKLQRFLNAYYATRDSKILTRALYFVLSQRKYKLLKYFLDNINTDDFIELDSIKCVKRVFVLHYTSVGLFLDKMWKHLKLETIFLDEFYEFHTEKIKYKQVYGTISEKYTKEKHLSNSEWLIYNRSKIEFYNMVRAKVYEQGSSISYNQLPLEHKLQLIYNNNIRQDYYIERDVLFPRFKNDIRMNNLGTRRKLFEKYLKFRILKIELRQLENVLVDYKWSELEYTVLNLLARDIYPTLIKSIGDFSTTL